MSTKPVPSQPTFWRRLKRVLSDDWKAVLDHPRPFMVAGAAVIAGTYSVLQWFNADRLAAKDDTIQILNARIGLLEKTTQDSASQHQREIERLRIAAGIDPASPRTSLYVLTTEELASKSQRLAAQIRFMYGQARARLRRFENYDKATNPNGFRELIRQREEEAQKINQAVGSDSLNVLNELHRRIPERSREHIISAGLALRVGDPINPGQEARLLFTGPIGGFFLDKMPIFADELEALSKLLPPDSD